MKKTKGFVKRGLALTAGAAATGIGGCEPGSVVCDPPPPPLCDTLDVDSVLRLEADRTSAVVDEPIRFTGGIDSTGTATIEWFHVYAPVGQVLEQMVIEPDSIAFAWTAGEPGGGSLPGVHSISLELSLRYVEPGVTRSCTESDTVQVEIDAEGNVQVLSLPGSTALATYFRLELDARPRDGAYELHATPSLPPDRRERLTWIWRCDAGTLESEGGIARYVPDPAREAAVIQVEARLGTRGLAVAVWHWRAGR